MAHTPGPWVVTGRNDHWVHIGPKKPSKRVLSVANLPAMQTDLDANTNLITAAPDLLAALREIEDALRKDSRDKTIGREDVEYHLDGQTMYRAINLARAAIAKAEGAAT